MFKFKEEPRNPESESSSSDDDGEIGWGLAEGIENEDPDFSQMRDSINDVDEQKVEARNKSNSERNSREPLPNNKALTISDDSVF